MVKNLIISARAQFILILAFLSRVAMIFDKQTVFLL